MCYLSQCLVDNTGVLKMVVREKVELIEEVSDVNATEWIHLRERQDTWESGTR